MYNLGIIKSGTGPELVGTLDFNLSSLSCLIGCFPHNNGSVKIAHRDDLIRLNVI